MAVFPLQIAIIYLMSQIFLARKYFHTPWYISVYSEPASLFRIQLNALFSFQIEKKTFIPHLCRIISQHFHIPLKKWNSDFIEHSFVNITKFRLLLLWRYCSQLPETFSSQYSPSHHNTDAQILAQVDSAWSTHRLFTSTFNRPPTKSGERGLINSPPGQIIWGSNTPHLIPCQQPDRGQLASKVSP